MLVLPVLAVVMTLSTISITTDDLKSLKSFPYSILVSVLLNYVILGGILLTMAWWLIDDRELWVGFVLLASVPPAVAVIPFSYTLGGDTAFSLRGMIGAYLLALAITPVMMMIFLGIGFINPLEVIIVLGELVIAPVIVSRILLFTGAAKHIDRWRGGVINWGFFIVVLTVIGLNQQVILGEPAIILPIAIIGLITTFVLGYALKLVAKPLNISNFQNGRVSVIIR